MSGAHTLDRRVLEQIAGGGHHDPHSVLGPHLDGDGLTIRVLRPFAATVQVEHAGATTDLRHEHAGIWSGRIDSDQVVDYRLVVTYDDGHPHRVDDPYRYLPTLGQVDLHLIGEGRHENLWEVLGAHVRTYDTPDGPTTGTSFAVWAPNAKGVRTIGDFNGWSGAAHPMRSLGSSGVWELFVPDVGDGTLYKFEVLGADSQWREKADPMAFATQEPPSTASRVYTSDYTWNDDAWIAERARGGWHERPMSIYELHIGSWRQGRSYRELATELVDYVSGMGFTHVEFLPVAEHPFGGSWGYQVSGYYAPSARFGDPDDLRFLIDALHQAGIGVIVDWVPAHFPKDEFSLGRFDGTPLSSTPTHVVASTPSGARTSLTSAAGRCATSWSRTRCTGWSTTTSTLCGSTRWRRCSTSTTPARRVSGRRTSTAAARTSRRSRSCRRPTRPASSGCPASRSSPRSRRRGRGSPARPTSAAWASGSSGTWAGCTTRCPTSRTTRCTGSTTTTR
jgi:1,4-alpha-glucan branching enzyme